MSDQNVLNQLRQQFPQHEFAPAKLQIMHKGRFANAIVYRYHDDKRDLVIKDFHHSPWFIRKTFARLFVNQETKALARLNGLPGVSPEYYRLSPISVAYSHIDGTPLRALSKQHQQLPVSFFHDLEHMVSSMHRRGLVHLDLRNMGNILCGDDGKPYFIDFQSSLRYARFPRWLQGFMRGADLSGVYKGWLALCEHPLPQVKERFFHNYNKIRKRWIFKGYPLHRARIRLSSLCTQVIGCDLIRRLMETLF